MSPPASDAGTAARLRALLADVVELVQVRLELFTVEARQELRQISASLAARSASMARRCSGSASR